MIKDNSQQIALTYGSEQLTYEQLFGKIDYFSRLTTISPGNHIVLFSHNRPAWIYTFYAVLKKRGIVVPVDYMSSASELAHILGDCDPSAIFCSQANLVVLYQAIGMVGCSVPVILIDEHEDFICNPQTTCGIKDFQTDDTAAIIYTSGTTASPLGVELTYNNLISNIEAVSKHIPIYKPDSRVLVLLPLHHIFPLMGTMIVPLYIGASISISPGMASEEIISTLQANRITILIGVPRLYAAIHKGITEKIGQSTMASILFKLARKINSKRFSKTIFGTVHRRLGGSLEVLVSGGAALEIEVGNDFKTLGFEVLEGYGMTEAAPLITFTRPGRVRIGSPGEKMPGIQIRIEQGEIVAKGANIMKGYYKNPTATAEVLKNGWLYTGDLGYIDKEGYLYITGRKKEIIVLPNGKNINPVELEDLLLNSPLVKDCGIFYHEKQLQALILPNQKAMAVYPGRTTEDILRHELIAPFNRQVSPFKKIMRIHITDKELPRTRLGKLQHFKLAGLLQQQPITEIVQPVFMQPEYQMIAGYLEKEKGQRVLPFHHPELDIGLDSLDKIGFQEWLLHTFGLSLPAHQIADFVNIAQLAEWVGSHKTKLQEIDVNWKDILQEKSLFKLPSTWHVGSIAFRISRYLIYSYFRFSARGMEKIPDGPCIIAPNHQSAFDGLFVASVMKTKQIRETYFYAKENHFRKRILKFLAAKNNIIIVNLNLDLKQSIQTLAEVLHQKKKLIIFPEGTRTLTGELSHFKRTFAILARELKVPIIPVAIHGAYKAMPKGRYLARFMSKIKVEFLPAVHVEDQNYDAICLLIMNQIQNSLNTSEI